MIIIVFISIAGKVNSAPTATIPIAQSTAHKVRPRRVRHSGLRPARRLRLSDPSTH